MDMVQTSFKNIFCFSHLRWDFVFQRPQHLISRFSKSHNVIYWEEPVFDADFNSFTTPSEKSENLIVITPHLSPALSENQQTEQLQVLLRKYLSDLKMDETIFWYYTPMALSFTDSFQPGMIVYDCMDELSAFDFAPTEISLWEQKLLQKADIVFTGGVSLYEAKKTQHHNIFAFPSSIDYEHFSSAKSISKDPEDQERIPYPRIGFFGVIDERFDHQLIKEIAERRPHWNVILIGPIVKINQDILPKNENIHYLGSKKYEQLPAYLSGWDIALIPFALNKSTQFISPTKTPEYLAAGVPVVSSAIHDVVFPYNKNNLVQIGKDTDDFIQCIERELNIWDKTRWLKKVDKFLQNNSWDNTFRAMQKLIEETYANRIQLAS